MHTGYYWWRDNRTTLWRVVMVTEGLVHFFGEPNIELDSKYLREFSDWGPRIEFPDGA